MASPGTRERAIGLARFVLTFEGLALLAAFVSALAYAGLARTPLVDAFSLTSFLLFFLILLYAALSGPGMFLSRPRLGRSAAARGWRRFVELPSRPDREFFELVMYTGLAFLLLIASRGITVLAEAWGR